jgi:hypothetical protein
LATLVFPNGPIANGSLSTGFSDTPSWRYRKLAATYDIDPETTIYIGGIFEKVAGTGITDYRHMIRAGDATT